MMKETETLTPATLAAMIDHTFLHPAGAPDAVEKLCREAKEYAFACAMVNPCEVARAVALLRGSGVRVGTVVGFPLGASLSSLKAAEAEQAIRDGAEEIDFVVDIRALKRAAAGDAQAHRVLLSELREQVQVCRRAGGERITTKLIVECCYLTDEEKRFAASLTREAGFDFVKTSTGFGTGGATAADVKLLRETVGPDMGVKAAGGIRTLADARAFLAAGATRLGCSASVGILKELA